MKFIPISGLNGGNVKNAVSQEVCPWWYQYVSEGTNNTQCLTLLDQLDAITIADRRADAPLRLPVLDRYTERGTMIMGMSYIRIANILFVDMYDICVLMVYNGKYIFQLIKFRWLI